jgi:ElaB/YqjD/DUF883 family membrane-anchored ribosome-binding protein
MSDDNSDKGETAGVASSGWYKIQTAEVLEEAARRLRSAEVPVNEEDVRQILNEVESRVSRFKTEVGTGYERIETDYQKKIEPVEHIIIEHPIPSVLIAAGIGVLIGMLIFKSRD